MSDLGPLLSAATAYGDERVAAAEADLRAEYSLLIAEQNAAYLALRAEFDAYRVSHPDAPPPPPPEPVPLMGMATGDNWDERVAETGPVAAHRVFRDSFDVAGIVAKIKEDHANGVTSFWSLKMPGSWDSVAAGTHDAKFKALGVELAKLDYETYGCFHHEPRDSAIKTPDQLKPWSAANARVIPLVKAAAGSRHHLGTVDNGFPWGVKAKATALTDAQLAIYYTPALLAAVDFLGGDFYDGATDTNVGEPAAVKLARFEAWAAKVAPGKPLAVGEWNAVTASDIFSGWDVLREGPWAIACLFNSDANNRPDLPTSLGGSWVLRGDRLAAFRDVLDQAMPNR